MLGVPDVDACRALCPHLPASADAGTVLADPRVYSWVAGRLTSFAAANAGSSKQVVRATLLEEPPSLDALEVTDKGSLNQRAILKRRAALVDELYNDASAPSPRVIVLAAAAAGNQGRVS
jgi:feruloyl-CoA synthase